MLFAEANRKNDGAVEFDLTVVGSAAEAMALLAAPGTERFDLILLDMMLPDTTGDELLPDLRSMVGEDVTIVMASAHSHTSLVQLCVRRGADAFLVKPLGSEEVRHIWQFVKELPDGSFKTHIDELKTSFNASNASGASSYAVAVPVTASSTSASFTTAATVLATVAAQSHLAQTSGAPTGSDSPLPDVVICAGCAPVEPSSSSGRSMTRLTPAPSVLGSAHACGGQARTEHARQSELPTERSAINLSDLPSSAMPSIIDRMSAGSEGTDTRLGLDSLALDDFAPLSPQVVAQEAVASAAPPPPPPGLPAAQSSTSETARTSARPLGVPRRLTDDSTNSFSNDGEGAVAADCKQM